MGPGRRVAPSATRSARSARRHGEVRLVPGWGCLAGCRWLVCREPFGDTQQRLVTADRRFFPVGEGARGGNVHPSQVRWRLRALRRLDAPRPGHLVGAGRREWLRTAMAARGLHIGVGEAGEARSAASPAPIRRPSRETSLPAWGPGLAWVRRAPVQSRPRRRPLRPPRPGPVAAPGRMHRQRAHLADRGGQQPGLLDEPSQVAHVQTSRSRSR